MIKINSTEITPTEEYSYTIKFEADGYCYISNFISYENDLSQEKILEYLNNTYWNRVGVSK